MNEASAKETQVKPEISTMQDTIEASSEEASMPDAMELSENDESNKRIDNNDIKLMAVDTYSSEPEKPSVLETIHLSPEDSLSQLSQEENQALEKYRVEVYVVKSDILYGVVDDVPLVVVPRPMQSQVGRRVHERGHFGVTKTEALLRREFWFKRVRQKLGKIIRRCVDCILDDHMKPWIVNEEDDFPEDSDSDSGTSGDRY